MVFGSGRVYCTRAGRNCNVVGRRTLSGEATAFKPQSSRQTARPRQVKLPDPPPPRRTSRPSFAGIREAFELPSHSPRRIFWRREAAVERTAAIFGAAWEWDSTALAPRTLRGWRFSLKKKEEKKKKEAYNNFMNLSVTID